MGCQRPRRGATVAESHAPGAVGRIEVMAGSVEDERFTGHTALKFGTSKEDLERGSLYGTTSGCAVGF
jgi:hypothetical protein